MNRPQKNNNPFAIMGGDSKWKGMTMKASDGFITFDSPVNGVRAGFINLINGYINGGYNTIETIFPRYAPKGHGSNDPESYIKNVSNLTGIPRSKKLETNEDVYKVGKAITQVEEGKFWVSQKDFDTGFNNALSSTKWAGIAETGLSIGTLLLFVFLIYIFSK